MGVRHTEGDVLAAGGEDTAGREGGQGIDAAADASRVGGLALAVLGDGVRQAGPRALWDAGQVLGEDGGDEGGGEEGDLHFGEGVGETSGIFRNSVSDGDVKEQQLTNVDLNGRALLLWKREQRDRYGRPDREYLATYIAPPESNHQAPSPGLGPAIVFRSSIGAPL